MEWLCEATPEEIVRVGRKAETLKELEESVREHIQNRIKRRNPEERTCRNCASKFVVVISGIDTCTVCGTSESASFSYCVSYNFNKDDYLKKKSRHNRVRWFNRLLVKHIANCDRRRLSNQFQTVVRCIERMRLERGRNIVRYKFYLLRLASRSNIKLRDPPEDIKTQKLINLLEDRLYGKVFVELGWKGTECPYYKAWEIRNISEKFCQIRSTRQKSIDDYLKTYLYFYRIEGV
jgi:hypothetical protein